MKSDIFAETEKENIDRNISEIMQSFHADIQSVV